MNKILIILNLLIFSMQLFANNNIIESKDISIEQDRNDVINTPLTSGEPVKSTVLNKKIDAVNKKLDSQMVITKGEISTNCNTGVYPISWNNLPQGTAGGLLTATIESVGNGEWTVTALVVNNQNGSTITSVGNIVEYQYTGNQIVAELRRRDNETTNKFSTNKGRSVEVSITTLNCAGLFTDRKLKYRIVWF